MTEDLLKDLQEKLNLNFGNLNTKGWLTLSIDKLSKQ